MTRLALIRHGVTAWNREGRLQGHRDVPLSPEGRAALAGRRVPACLLNWTWVASPLSRCRETLEILYPGPYLTDKRLMEMHWGEWEGRTLAELRRDGLTAAREAQGLDFRPPGGESPRLLQARLRPFLAEVAARGRPTVAVVHKGVIRAMLAMATGWDMRGKAPAKLDWSCAHLFRLEAGGDPVVDRLNLPLVAAEAEG